MHPRSQSGDISLDLEAVVPYILYMSVPEFSK